MTDFVDATPSASQRSAEIEMDIHRTRERMGQGLEAIGDKFRPERIKQRAKAAVSRKGANLFRTAKENPVPTAIIALGLTLLFKARSKERGTENGDGYATRRWSGQDLDLEELDRDVRDTGQGLKGKTHELAGNAKDKVQEVAGTAREKVSHAAEQVSEKAKRTGNTLQRFFESNPLIAGAGVVVLGAAIGALIPESQKEKQIMGHARDQIVDKAKNVAQHAQGAFDQKMSERHSSQQ